MKLIKLNHVMGHPIMVNPLQIAALVPEGVMRKLDPATDSQMKCAVVLAGAASSYFVTETLEIITSLLEDA